MLAVGEACSNAVEHGHVDQGDFTVTCMFGQGVLRAEIIDSGGGFDAPTSSQGIDPTECIGRGRGIAIMRALMDSVAYRRTPAGMAVVLEKHLLARGVEKSSGELGGRNAGRGSQTR